MAMACPGGHRLHFTRVLPCERGCDVCSKEIKAPYAYHCGACDYDLCGECHLPVEGSLLAEREEVLTELACLCSEQDELQAEEEDEESANDALALHDAQLLRLRLQGVLQRYSAKTPDLEVIAPRLEEEIAECALETQQLREDNLALALPSARAAGGGSRSDAAAHSEQVLELWSRRAHTAKLRRQAQINEFYLGNDRSEMQATAKELRARERQLRDLRKQQVEASTLSVELAQEATANCEDVDRELGVVQELHRQALAMREACHVPADLKKKSSILLKALDRDSGRLGTEKRLRNLQATSKLYSIIASQVPALQSLASRAKAAAETELERYQNLEHAHGQQLQRLHLVATRGVLGHLANGDGHSASSP